MKIYKNPEPEKLVRITIKKQGVKNEYITVCQTTQAKVYDFVKKLIEKENLSPFSKGCTTNIQLREAVGAKNGKAISLSFKGLDPSHVHSLILKNILNQ